jgi:hypothetical protein
MKSKSIDLFENLSQGEYEGKYFDFHNDFDCVKILLLPSGFLILLFKNILNGEFVKMKFTHVSIRKMEFFNFNKVENLTIDNLYRGRVEIDGDLLEFKDGDIGYFYLEFDEGQKLEFWSSGFIVEM